MRALIVDDDVPLARLIQASLQSAGIESDSEATAATGIAALAHTRYDCALIDVVLPGSSGLYVIESIRRLAAARRPEVIIMTGSDGVIFNSFDRSLVKAVMFKPLNVPALVAFVKSLR